MPFTIHWVDHCSGPETSETLQLPLGTLLITRQSDVITNITWAQQILPETDSGPQRLHPWLDPQTNVTLSLLKQGTPFRNQVWAELCKIPYGTTLTYAGLAKNIGSAARAVGNACRDNPYPLVIPCHRVVSASGMGGYCGQVVGDFMAIKVKLLAFEAANQ
jgi:methylated-DNA-[protein]-cysteine S-methyltransferase